MYPNSTLVLADIFTKQVLVRVALLCSGVCHRTDTLFMVELEDLASFCYSSVFAA